jgi:hypothetical protein
MGGDPVAEVAVPRRTGPGDLRADPTAGRRPDLHVMPVSEHGDSGRSWPFRASSA